MYAVPKFVNYLFDGVFHEHAFSPKPQHAGQDVPAPSNLLLFPQRYATHTWNQCFGASVIGV
jgi:hypothetical protein